MSGAAKAMRLTIRARNDRELFVQVATSAGDDQIFRISSVEIGDGQVVLTGMDSEWRFDLVCVEAGLKLEVLLALREAHNAELDVLRRANRDLADALCAEKRTTAALRRDLECVEADAAGRSGALMEVVNAWVSGASTEVSELSKMMATLRLPAGGGQKA